MVRDRASLARLVDDGQIENVYRLQIMNATEQPQRYHVGVQGVQGLQGIQIEKLPPLALDSAEARWVTLNVRVPPEAAAKAGPGAHEIHFQIELIGADAGGRPMGGAAVSEKSTFVVPR